MAAKEGPNVLFCMPNRTNVFYVSQRCFLGSAGMRNPSTWTGKQGVQPLRVEFAHSAGTARGRRRSRSPQASGRWMPEAPPLAAAPAPEMNRIQLILIDVNNSMIGSYLAAIDRILPEASPPAAGPAPGSHH
jgi:hypothetical protein